MEEDLIICRCEEVTLAEIERAVQDGARTEKGIKHRTRAGMGACQGRVCQPLVRAVLARSEEEVAAAATRPPACPVLLAEIVAIPVALPDGEAGDSAESGGSGAG